MATLLALRVEKRKKRSAVSQAKALAGSTKSQTLPPVERDFLGPVSITPDILSGEMPLSAPPTHPLEYLAAREEFPWLTVQADNAMKDGLATPESVREKIRWFGKVYELAASIKNDCDQRHFGDITLERAFAHACEHYVQSDGTPFTARSLRESLRQINKKADGDI